MITLPKKIFVCEEDGSNDNYIRKSRHAKKKAECDQKCDHISQFGDL